MRHAGLVIPVHDEVELLPPLPVSRSDGCRDRRFLSALPAAPL